VKNVRVPPPGYLASLGDVQAFVVRLEIPQVEAERAADQRRHRHMGVGLQVLVALVPPRGLLPEAETETEHLLVVPHHLEALGHLTERLLGEPLQHGAVGSGDLGLGDPGVAGHLILLAGVELVDAGRGRSVTQIVACIFGRLAAVCAH
jgi:hypothetical protein